MKCRSFPSANALTATQRRRHDAVTFCDDGGGVDGRRDVPHVAAAAVAEMPSIVAELTAIVVRRSLTNAN